jgi:recombination protein RecR
MDVLPDNVQKLIRAFERLPGFGPKSAARIAMFMLKSPERYQKELGTLLLNLKRDILYCSICNNLSSHSPCTICSSQKREQSVICVVEDPLDVVAFEGGSDYQGIYHVLGGVISPVNGIGPEDLSIEKLLKRVKHKNIKEVILATNPNIEGEATAMYIKEEILKQKEDIRISRLARGLPTGADLEYADKTTIKRALEGRTEFE